MTVKFDVTSHLVCPHYPEDNPKVLVRVTITEQGVCIGLVADEGEAFKREVWIEQVEGDLHVHAYDLGHEEPVTLHLAGKDIIVNASRTV